MSTSTHGTLKPAQVATLRKNWQTCLPQQLPDAFYAFDVKDQQSERLVTTYLEGKSLQRLLKIAQQIKNRKKDKSKEKYPQLVVYLGLDRSYMSDKIEDQPAFQLIVQVKGKKAGKNENCFLMNWEPNPLFPTNPYHKVTSGPDAIPSAAAYLFVLSWLETPIEELADVFESSATLLGKRAKSYTFSYEESKDILEALGNGKSTRLSIHLGKGLTVYQHPIPFRPIVEAGPRTDVYMARSLDDGGNSFFDFSKVCPPYCNP